MGYGSVVEGYPAGFERELAEAAAARGAGRTGERAAEEESSAAARRAEEEAAERESADAAKRAEEEAERGTGTKSEGQGENTGSGADENTSGEEKPKDAGDPNAGPNDPTQADPNNPEKSEKNASENDIEGKKEQLEKEKETANPERKKEIEKELEELEGIKEGRFKKLGKDMMNGGWSATKFVGRMLKKLFTKDGLKVLLALFIGMEIMIKKQMQTDGECRRLCESRNNPKGTCSDPNIPDAVCPTTTKNEDCGKYCETACSVDNRLARAKQRVLDDPAGTALNVIGDTIDNVVDAPGKIWDTFKYVFIGIGVILLLVIVYKFSTAWVSGKAASMTIMGATRGSSGITDKDVQNYKNMKDNINAINSS